MFDQRLCDLRPLYVHMLNNIIAQGFCYALQVPFPLIYMLILGKLLLWIIINIYLIWLYSI